MDLEWYHQAIIGIAIVAAIASHKTPRAWVWIVGIMAAFLLSSAYAQRHEAIGVWSPLPPAITFMCDALFAAIIHKTHRERWEYWGLFIPFSLSSLISFMQNLALLAGFPPPLEVVYYASLLEAITALCLLLIGGIGVADLVGHRRLDSSGSYGRSLAKVAHLAHSKTTASKARWEWSP